jgi:hypothetical protein
MTRLSLPEYAFLGVCAVILYVVMDVNINDQSPVVVSFPTDTPQQQYFAQQVQAMGPAAVQRVEDATRYNYRFWRTARITAVWFVVLAIAFLLFQRRDAIARWYYFTFHPHPAETQVRSAIASGRLLDGKQLAAVLGEAPPASGIFREVRIEQSRTLVSEMQEATRAHLRELERHAKDQYAQAAVLEAQAALAAAAVALESAKAMLDASKRSSHA